MRNYYKISEISKLYGIGIDSLRYYEEIGLLKPRRGENNYRLYSLKDLYKLNIIRELRPLNFSMQQIKEYLEQQTVEHSLDLFFTERENIKEQIANLESIDISLEERINSINESLTYVIGKIGVHSLPKRYCVQLSTNISRDEEADFAIQKLHQQYEEKIYDLGKQPIGATLHLTDLKNKQFNLFRSVFYILDGGRTKGDFVLPEGEYLSYFYKGDYTQSSMQMNYLLEYSKKQGLEIVSDLYEIYHIDNRYTIKPEEFITEIQVMIATE